MMPKTVEKGSPPGLSLIGRNRMRTFLFGNILPALAFEILPTPKLPMSLTIARNTSQLTTMARPNRHCSRPNDQINQRPWPPAVQGYELQFVAQGCSFYLLLTS